jgi:hypothetical protein
MNNELTINGLTFRVSTVRDDDACAPWDAEDGHGPVSDWRWHEDARDGERALSRSRGRCRFYDWNEALVIAARESWGLAPETRASLGERLGHEPSAEEVTEEAVRLDFERLRAWCDDEWEYLIVCVTLLDIAGDATGEDETLGGVESDCTDYMNELAADLARQIAGRVGDEKYLTTRATRQQIRE